MVNEKEGLCALIQHHRHSKDIVLYVVFLIQMQNLSLCRAPSFEGLAGAE